MSVHHHDSLYFSYLGRTQRDCITPGCLGRNEQYHHMELVGARKYAGPLPRRHSTYNVVPVCARCHRTLDSVTGERRWIAQNFAGGLAGVYRVVLPWLASYKGVLSSLVYEEGIPVPPTKAPEVMVQEERGTLPYYRAVAGHYHDQLTYLMELRQASAERTGQA